MTSPRVSVGICARCSHAKRDHVHENAPQLGAVDCRLCSCEQYVRADSPSGLALSARSESPTMPERPPPVLDVPRFVSVASGPDGALVALDAAGDVWVYRYAVPGFTSKDTPYKRADAPAHWEKLASVRGKP